MAASTVAAARACTVRQLLLGPAARENLKFASTFDTLLLQEILSEELLRKEQDTGGVIWDDPDAIREDDTFGRHDICTISMVEHTDERVLAAID